MVWACMVLLAMQLVAHTSFATPPKSNEQIAQEIFTLVNQYRQKKGLAPLKYSSVAAAEAQAHSNKMAKRSVMSHAGFDGRFDRMRKKIPHMVAAAENVAYGANGAARAVDMWLHSAGHKKNIRGNYTHTGIGVARNKRGVLYYTQVFVRVR